MKKLAVNLLADVVISHRNARRLTQAQVAAMIGINRTLLSRLEAQNYTPSID